MKLLITTAIAITTSISGCGLVQTQKATEWMAQTPVSAWGEPPSDFSSAQSVIQSVMIDPESTRFKFVKSYRNWFQSRDQFIPYWYVEVLVNSKNRFGGYTGDKLMLLAYDNKGKLRAVDLEGKGRDWKFLN